MPAYRILSLDGGGIRGVFTARLLARLDGAAPGFLQHFDLFAGTSTGGILALGVAAGLHPDELVRLYRDNGAIIFDDSWLDDLRDLGSIAGARYHNSNITRILTDIFAKRNVITLNDLPKQVLIPTFDLDDGQDPRRTADKPRTWKPKFFHNYPCSQFDGAELIVDVAMRTSAAPTYFPSYGRFIDGGVVANNPAVAALAQALNNKTGKQQVSDICLLSLGTGTNPTYIEGNDLDWGYAQWAKPIIGLMMDGVMGVADYQCSQILDNRYHRITCILDQVIPLDCYQKVDALIQYADEVDISATVAWLREYVIPASAETLIAVPGKRVRRAAKVLQPQ